MHYHFVGIKGGGMASLTTIVADRGNKVSGSDIEKYTFTQQPPEERHIPIASFSADNIHEGDTVIIENTFNESNPEVKKALAMGAVRTYQYHEFFGSLAKEYTSISVAGTHGKTTMTGILSHIMSLAAPTGYLIGNGADEMPKDSRYLVLESCEYQRHFLAYKPEYTIITNIELDHIDCYKNMEGYCNASEAFANQIQKGVVPFGNSVAVRSLHVRTEHLYYGLKDHDDAQAVHVKQHKDGMQFDVLYRKKLFTHFDLPFAGRPLLWNSLGIIAIGTMEGLSGELLQEGLQSFPDVRRRFIVEENGDNVYIDDYTHHPTAVKYIIEAARTKYPGKKVIALFKPDRYFRIYYFMDRFAEELSQTGEVYLCHFPENAAGKDGIGITISDLADKYEKATAINEDEEAARILTQRDPAVYLFMGNRSVYKLGNIVRTFQRKLKKLTNRFGVNKEVFLWV